MKSLLPEADVVTRATHVRSTLLQTSLRKVKEFGNYERWLENVDPEHRTTIVECVAPSWVPIATGLAHYQACDKFGLDDATLQKIGHGVGEQLQGTLLSVAAKVAREAGLTPEAAAACFGRLWPRLFQGGSLQLMKDGPKDLQIELRAAVLTKSRYFRATYVGNVRAALDLLGTRALYVKPLPYEETLDRFVVRVSYV